MPQEWCGGLERIAATTAVLQRARRADPRAGMWEAADVQWWWRRPRPTDALELPVWSDDDGPVAVAGLSAWDDTWQVDVHVVPGTVDEQEVWAAALAAAIEHHDGPLQVLVHEGSTLAARAAGDGFAPGDEGGGTTWMDAEARPPVATVDGFTVVDRAAWADGPHWLIARNGVAVEQRLQQGSSYDPTLDLAVVDDAGTVAGYALFWNDPTTGVGLLEPMRVEEAFQRRGLARALVTAGQDRLARSGARRLKVGFETEAARALYTGAGFVQTSVDLFLARTT